MKLEEINKKLQDPNISKELKEALEKRKEILINNKDVKK
jgi:nickel-dependent lactate racemase